MDDELLLVPLKEPPKPLMVAIDVMGWLLPVVAAVLSVWGGIEALWEANDYAAILSIVGGVAGALGVLFTNWASRIRDHRLALAHGIGNLALEIADEASRRAPASPF